MMTVPSALTPSSEQYNAPAQPPTQKKTGVTQSLARLSLNSFIPVALPNIVHGVIGSFLDRQEYEQKRDELLRLLGDGASIDAQKKVDEARRGPYHNALMQALREVAYGREYDKTRLDTMKPELLAIDHVDIDFVHVEKYIEEKNLASALGFLKEYCPNLRSLRLYCVVVTVEHVQILAEFSSLRTITFDKVLMDAGAITHLPEYLDEVSVTTGSSGRGLAPEDVIIFLQRCKNLTKLQLNTFPFLSDGDSILPHIPVGITDLDLSHNQNLTGDALTACIRRCPGLKNLNLEMTGSTDAVIAALPSGLNRVCVVPGNSEITAAAVIEFLKRSRELIAVKFDTSITRQVMQFIPDTVVEVKLSFISDVKALKDLFMRCQNLKTANLSFSEITDEVLALIPIGVEDVDLGACKHLTTAGIRQFLLRCKNLKKLDCNSEKLTEAELPLLPEGPFKRDLIKERERKAKECERKVKELQSKPISLDFVKMMVAKKATGAFVSQGTSFEFSRDGHAKYYGGKVRSGNIIGKLATPNRFVFSFCQMQQNGEPNGGVSQCDVLRNAEGKIILKNFTKPFRYVLPKKSIVQEL